MWFFNSPEVIYGEGALGYLDELPGRRAFIVTDPVLDKLGLKLEGRLREKEYFKGRWWDTLMYAILEAERIS